MPIVKTELEKRLFLALKRISQYQTPEQLRRNSRRDYVLDDPAEALEYAYENVLHEAKMAVRRVRMPKEGP